MNAKDEQKSLVENTLPDEVTVKQEGDDQLPSLILDYDNEIILLKARILSTQAARQSAIERAIALKIGADDRAIIIVREKESNREIDPKLFKEQKPEVFEKARQVEIAAAQEKIQQQIDALSKLEVPEPAIRVGTVETLNLREDEIALICKPRTITRTYEVIKAGTALPKGKGVKRLTEG